MDVVCKGIGGRILVRSKIMKIVYFQGYGAPRQWYWHLVAKNGHIIATGGEGYASRRNVVRAVNRFRSLMRCEALPVVGP